MNEQKIKAEAQRVYDQTRMSDDALTMYGDSPNEQRRRFPNAFATVADFEAHIRMCYEVAEAVGVNLDWRNFKLGTSREIVTEAAEAKVKAQRRSAGARALSRKYGKAAAERIIERKTGRHIDLQH